MSGSKKTFPNYQPQAIEPKWQRFWEETGLYLAHEGGGKPKYYCMDFFPYPSGDGLHVGHCRNYVPTDVLSRYKRMRGYNVLHPMGWDAFGEPAEQFAVRHGVHPRITTDQNTANFRRQYSMLGISFDWAREIDSSAPGYYRWTQWFFLMLYKRGLAYRDTNWQWWCPTCMTTLSSHEVQGSVCWRGHTGIIRRQIPAWYFRITAYADRLLEGLDRIDWPEKIKAMQRNWIGRSEGVEVIFSSAASQTPIKVFTTRPDTLYGVTFFALAPEHPLIDHFTTSEQRSQVDAYRAQAAMQSEVERMNETRPKTGVFTGGYVTNPLSRELVPVWVADYVLSSYGTGAVMGVPAHDQRDFEFAQEFNLPVKVVITSPDCQDESLSVAFTSEGTMVNSGPFNGLSGAEAVEKVIAELERLGLGQRSVQYRMRDWLISRQRYWGTPIPIIHCPSCGEVPVPDDQLPVLLPPMQDFQPDGSGRSPLARLPEFVNTTCLRCGEMAQRETDTMGGFACSSWYFLRFTSPHFDEGSFESSAMNYWMPVDIYVGGAEHAVLHLLYSRFWTKVMYDAGLVPFDEPFAKLLNQGQLMGPDGKRMSKSRGNVITPDEIVASHGADALRVYELFMAPFEQDVDWSTDGLNGAWRFLNRVWSLVGETFSASASASKTDLDLERLTHRTIQHVTERIETQRFNTVVSGLMEYTNALLDLQANNAWRAKTFHQALEILLILLAPIAPHISEELWALTGHSGSIHQQSWPRFDPQMIKEDLVQMAVQVDGKLRAVIEVDGNMPAEEMQMFALEQPKVQASLVGKQVKKVIVVQRKIVSIVTDSEPKKKSTIEI
jgi:leucyl-tRNA synthetase